MNTEHGSQSRSWSGEQGKENKEGKKPCSATLAYISVYNCYFVVIGFSTSDLTTVYIAHDSVRV